MDIMKSVSNLSNFDEMKTSMIELEKDLKEVFYLFTVIIKYLFYLKKKKIGLVSDFIETSVGESFSTFDEKKEIVNSYFFILFNVFVLG